MSHEDFQESKGFITGYESNPEYASSYYGTIKIPLSMLDEAIEAGEIYVYKGNNYVELSFSLYEYDGDFEPRPAFNGSITRRKQKNGNGNGRYDRNRNDGTENSSGRSSTQRRGKRF